MPRYTVFAEYKVSFAYEIEAENETEAAKIASMENVVENNIGDSPEYISSDFVGVYSIEKEEDE
jgi:hypothetical protein